MEQYSDEFEIFLRELDGPLEQFAAAHSCACRKGPPGCGMRFLNWESDGLHRHMGIMSAHDQHRAKLRIRISVSTLVQKSLGRVTFVKNITKQCTKNKLLEDTADILGDCFLLANAIRENELRDESELVREHEDALKAMTYRNLYIKLPVRQTQFHWRFQDQSAFLAGRLSLCITDDSRSENITIFADGHIMEGWAVIGKSKTPDTDIYFGFASTKAFLVSNQDKVEIVLDVVKDLEGIGPMSQGILKKGQYRTQSKFTIYEPDGTAFTGDKNCVPLWDIIVTRDEGWMANGNRKI